ncbi:uncharacterized protein F5147DRAFT_665207 [Suillus discolor]|uniref:Uncharacterized protein n=1 Tax=Suillus discolor TaxID=1912936 RepID=A0A9P7K127_9AGAM|nr:uncharacterized protein F5147DRAFT_665207 [Suillus discolor]KAG2119752.1 hypothetical protein F5147DRAFT_665207 [Suillus discolor]
MTKKSEPTHTSPVLLVGLTTAHASSRSTSNTQSSSRTATTGTISSSSYANTTVTSSSSSSKKTEVLSTGARVGLGFGIVFFFLLSIVLFYYLKRLYQRTREKAGYKPPLSASEGRNPPPPHPNSQYPFSAPARPSSYYSPIYSIPYETSENATMMATSSVPAADSSSNSQPGRQLLAPHADIPRYQNELEQRKWNLDEAQESHHPPPKYSF